MFIGLARQNVYQARPTFCPGSSDNHLFFSFLPGFIYLEFSFKGWVMWKVSEPVPFIFKQPYFILLSSSTSALARSISSCALSRDFSCRNPATCDSNAFNLVVESRTFSLADLSFSTAEANCVWASAATTHRKVKFLQFGNTCSKTIQFKA